MTGMPSCQCWTGMTTLTPFTPAPCIILRATPPSGWAALSSPWDPKLSQTHRWVSPCFPGQHSDSRGSLIQLYGWCFGLHAPLCCLTSARFTTESVIVKQQLSRQVGIDDSQSPQHVFYEPSQFASWCHTVTVFGHSATQRRRGPLHLHVSSLLALPASTLML